MAEGAPKPSDNPENKTEKKWSLKYGYTSPPGESQGDKPGWNWRYGYDKPPAGTEKKWNWMTGYDEEKDEIKKARERAAAQGMSDTRAGVVFGAAGAALGGGLWSIGHVLKYSLLGWTLDANGIPRKDSAALAQFEKSYKAAKEQGVIGGITGSFAA